MIKLIALIKNILNSQLYTISLYSRQVAGTVVLLLVTRMLPVYEYGLMRSYVAIASFLLMFANLGYNEYILVSSKNVVREIQIKIGFFTINAIATVVIIMMISAFVPLKSYLIFVLVLLRTFFDGTFFCIMLPYFQATRKFNLISYVNIFYSFITVLIAIICYIFHFSLATFLLLGIFLGIFNFIQVTYYSGVKYSFALKYLKRIFKKIDKTIFSYAGVVLCAYLYMQIPSLYISTFISKETAALYFAAYTIASIIALLMVAQAQKIIPEMINSSIQDIKTIITKNIKLITIINAILLTFFIIFGKQILTILYGRAVYADAYLMLIILSISNFSYALICVYGSYLTASGNQKIKMRMQMEAIMISLIVLALFHKLGVYSAVISYFITYSYIGLKYCIESKKIINLNKNV